MRRSIKFPLEVQTNDLGIKVGTLKPGDPAGMQGNSNMTDLIPSPSATLDSMHQKYLYGLLENGMKPLGLVYFYIPLYFPHFIYYVWI